MVLLRVTALACNVVMAACNAVMEAAGISCAPRYVAVWVLAATRLLTTSCS